MEILRQSDPGSRKRTAQVMDRFGKGFALLPCHDLADLEMVNFIMSFSLGKDKCYHNEEMAWIFPSYVLGLAHPAKIGYDAATELAIQKTLFEHSRHRTIEDTISIMDSDGILGVLMSDEEFQAAQNATCAIHNNEFNTYKQCFENEVIGRIDLYNDYMMHACARLWEIQTGQKCSEEHEAPLVDFSNKMHNIIGWGCKLGKLSSELPALHIMCSLHAYKRYKHVPFQKGDQHDFHHARTALPYCDYFFTERRLGQMLCDDLLTMDKAYNCKVMWSPNDIISALKNRLGM